MASAMRSRQQLDPKRSVASMDARRDARHPDRATQRRVRRPQSQPPETLQRPVVQALPQPQPAPAWLVVLVKVQRFSSVPTLLLIIGLLIVYGWTVYTQQRWGKAYSHLEALQKQERQLTATNEVLKNQMAKQTEAPDVGLVLPDPGNTIYLTPAPQRPAVEPEVNLPPPQPIPARPLGY